MVHRLAPTPPPPPPAPPTASGRLSPVVSLAHRVGKGVKSFVDYFDLSTDPAYKNKKHRGACCPPGAFILPGPNLSISVPRFDFSNPHNCPNNLSSFAPIVNRSTRLTAGHSTGSWQAVRQHAHGGPFDNPFDGLMAGHSTALRHPFDRFTPSLVEGLRAWLRVKLTARLKPSHCLET